MPSKSKAQHNLMAMVANDPAAAKRVGIPQSVGEEYVKADKGKKFGTGGSRARPDLQKVNKPSTRHGKSEFFAEGGMPLKLESESEKRSSDSDESKRKAVSGMKKGGMAESKKMVGKEVAFMKKKGAPKSMIKHEMAEAGMKKGGMAKYAAGGSVKASAMGKVVAGGKRAHGEHTVQQKGHTKGKMVKMAYGGKTKAC